MGENRGGRTGSWLAVAACRVFFHLMSSALWRLTRQTGTGVSGGGGFMAVRLVREGRRGEGEKEEEEEEGHI